MAVALPASLAPSMPFALLSALASHIPLVSFHLTRLHYLISLITLFFLFFLALTLDLHLPGPGCFPRPVLYWLGLGLRPRSRLFRLQLNQSKVFSTHPRTQLGSPYPT